MTTRSVKRITVSVLAAAVLSLGAFGAADVPASAKSTCGSGAIGDIFSSANPERARTYSGEHNPTQGTSFPGVSGTCNPNGPPEKQQGAP